MPSCHSCLPAARCFWRYSPHRCACPSGGDRKTSAPQRWGTSMYRCTSRESTLEGINDIGQACLGNVENTAEDIIGGYQQIITQVHLKGIKIFGATLTP